MELLETNDAKRDLLRRSAAQKAALEDEVRVLSERTERALINALVVGGTLAVGYLVYRQLSNKGKKKKRKYDKNVVATSPQLVESEEDNDQSSGILAGVGGIVASQLLSVLLALAKEKLIEYLHSEEKQKPDDHS